MDYMNRYFKLARRPSGLAAATDFDTGEAPAPPLGPGQFLVKTEYISVDPTNRIWMSDMDQYMPPVRIGEVMRAGGVGTVAASKHPGFAVGDTVSGLLGWQTYVVSTGERITKLPDIPGVPKSAFLGALGMTGVTAYFGLLDIGKPREGETIVVSAAAGAVGSVVCQIAKLKGLRVVGIAGATEKCAWLEDDVGIDGTINYKEEDVGRRLDALCPNGIDIYFENVGGVILDAVLPRMNLFGRVPLCGMISTYNDAEDAVPGPYQFRQILMKRLTVQGFIIIDYAKRFPEATEALGKWMAAGKLKSRETIVRGFERLPEAMNMLFTGENIGKLLVQV